MLLLTMKKQPVLLLHPLFSLSQSNKVVISIKSLDTFKKVAIENNYEYSGEYENERATYVYNLKKDSTGGDRAVKRMYYNPIEQGFGLSFSKSRFFAVTIGETEYDKILTDVKDKCVFFKILNHSGDDYACYTCPESKYKGKIGFMIKDENRYIRTFPESKRIYCRRLSFCFCSVIKEDFTSVI